MNSRRKILVLTPRFPYPVVGGDRLRIHAICRALAEEYSLTLLSLCEQRSDFDPAVVTDAVFDRIERVYLPRWRSLAKVVAALPGRTPLQVAYYRSHEFARRVAELLPSHDLAFAHLIRTGSYLAGRREKPSILEMTDAISMNYARVREHGSIGLRGRIYALEQKRLESYERQTHRAFSAVSLVAEADARHLWGATFPGNVVIASNGVDCHALPWRGRENNAPIAVFIGNMYSAQNMDACRYFATEVLPLLSDRDVAEFRVVGRIREADAAWLRAHPRVTVTGEVNSIPQAVKDGRFGICSVRLGAGVQNKILEYMALGLPVITSPVGHEGIAATEDNELLVAETATDFALQLRRLNEDRALYSRLARNGRTFVETRHDWSASLAPLLTRARSLVST